MSALRRIVLLTDFGTRDPYVAAMKGVIVARTEALVDDASHEIAPFDVAAGSRFLATIVPYWPAGTIFVCVVDPGVGTARRIIAVEKDDRLFLAPDNGLLSFLLPLPLIVSVENEEFFLPDGSNTFHGRDRFAPVAAALANGASLSDLGPVIEEIVLLGSEVPVYGPERVTGTIVAIDRFGNAITDVERARIPFGSFVLRAGLLAIERLESNYDGEGLDPFLIVGSTGHIEISIARGSAAETLRLRTGQDVEIRPRAV